MNTRPVHCVEIKSIVPVFYVPGETDFQMTDALLSQVLSVLLYFLVQQSKGVLFNG